MRTASDGRTVRPAPFVALGAAVLIALGLRLYGVTWGLPQVFNGDEPHIVKTAVSFGSGDLNPHVFKYPTLWMYLLFFAYGAYFLLWSGFGLRRTVEQFGGLFAWHQGGFYLIARLLAVAFSVLGVAAVGWTEDSLNRRRGRPAAWFPWAAAILAVSPFLNAASQGGKADALMFFFAALAWRWGLEVYYEGRPRDYLLAGLFTGLSLSSQFTALPVLAVLPLAHLLRRKDSRGESLVWLAAAGAAAFLAFFASSPFVVLDYRGFLSTAADLKRLYASAETDHWRVFKRIAGIAFWQAGVGSLGAAALAWGAWVLARKEGRLAALLLGPFALYAAFMCTQVDGETPRYFFGVYPALALVAGAGAADAVSRVRSKPLWAVLAAWALAPGFVQNCAQDRRQLLPDTRELAKAWIEANVPEGAGLLLDQEHASPDLVMDRGRMAELLRQNEALGSRRARYYALALKFHPGGGYRIWRVERSAEDLWSAAGAVERSRREGPYLDVSAGLSVLKAKGIRYAVTSGLGANPERAPALRRFFGELERRARLVKEFRADDRAVAGPLIRIYDIE